MPRSIERFTIPVLAVFLVSVGAQTSAGVQTPAGSEASAQESACFLMSATVEQAEARPSPLKQVRFTYEGGEGLFCHSAPSARGREIMGGLVPYGQPWRLGANEPTAIHLSASATIGGVELEAGSYSIYTIPGEGEWEFFLNSQYERWGIPITDEVRATEVGSFTVTAEATDAMVEVLTFTFADGALVMEWENTRVIIPIG